MASHIASERYQQIVEDQREILKTIQREREVQLQEQIRKDEQQTGKAAALANEVSPSLLRKRTSFELEAPRQPLYSPMPENEGGMSRRRRISKFCCDCCHEDSIIGYTCGNEHGIHTLCKGCIAGYVHAWLFGYNSKNNVECFECEETSTVQCHVPCFCSQEECHSSFSVRDVTDILSARQIDHLKKKLQSMPNVSYTTINNNHPGFAIQPKTLSSKARKVHRKLSFERAQQHRQLKEVKTGTRLRTCPGCSQELDKKKGCNKMKCANCKTVMCYCCRQGVPGMGYDHFSVDQEKDQSKKSKCLLWTSAQEDSERELALIRDKIYRMAHELWNS
jgi:hypothetical protein